MTPVHGLDKAYELACGRFDGENFDALAEVDRVLVTIWGLEGDVNNGGFDQYYFNSSGDQAFFAPEALRLIGAHRMADIVSRANAAFGPDGPSRRREERQSERSRVAPEIDDTPGPWDELDREFYAYPDDISELAIRYLENNHALR